MTTRSREDVYQRLAAHPTLGADDPNHPGHRVLLDTQVLAALNDMNSQDGQSLTQYVMSDETLRALFTRTLPGTDIAYPDTHALREFVFSQNAPILGGAYTSYDNRVGIFVTNDYRQVQLSYPYADCTLLGAMDQEQAAAGDEPMINQILDRDQIDRLFTPKVLVDAVRLGAGLPVEGVSLAGSDGDLFIKDKETGRVTLRDHLVLNGNNLIALHCLDARLHGQVNAIYIDPPYYFSENKSVDSFAYNSNFKLPTWLAFMRDRLNVARGLMSAKDGHILISTNLDGQAHLKLLCDDVFGAQQFVGMVTWEANTSPSSTEDAAEKLQRRTEFVLVYKTYASVARFHREVSKEKEYPMTDQFGPYRTEVLAQEQSRGSRVRPTLQYEICGISPKKGFCWRRGKEFMEKKASSGEAYAENGRVVIKIRPNEEDTNSYSPVWSHFANKEDYGTAKNGLSYLRKLMGNEIDFNTVKPVALIQKLLFHLKVPKDAVILDFFGGSGTTMHAVMALNASDGGARKCILVEQMSYARDLTADRNRRAIEKHGFVRYDTVTGEPLLNENGQPVGESLVFARIKRTGIRERLAVARTIDDLKSAVRSCFDLGAFPLAVSAESLCSDLDERAATIQVKTAGKSKKSDDQDVEIQKFRAAFRWLMEKHFDPNVEYVSLYDLRRSESGSWSALGTPIDEASARFSLAFYDETAATDVAQGV